MALNNQDQAQIRQYLLGKLSEAEQEKIEERLMVEDELLDEFEASKDELVEEYCAGDLEHAERDWFESHYLASAEGRQRQAFALTMDYYMKRHASNPAPRTVTPPPSPTFFERFATFVRTNPGPRHGHCNSARGGGRIHLVKELSRTDLRGHPGKRRS